MTRNVSPQHGLAGVGCGRSTVVNSDIGRGWSFAGEGKGDLSAFDAKTSKRLWGFNCVAGASAP